jgi:hypothetical protein
MVLATVYCFSVEFHGWNVFYKNNDSWQAGQEWVDEVLAGEIMVSFLIIPI